jgi:Bacterial Ig-like domain (group 3)/Beta-propeller repeat
MTRPRSPRPRTLTLFIAVFTSLIAFAPGQQTYMQQPFASPPAALPSAAQAKIADTYGKLPLSFEANQGQTDPQVKFLSRGSGYSLFLTGDEAVLALPAKRANGKRRDDNLLRTIGKGAGKDSPHPDVAAAAKAGGVLRMKLRNANPAAKIAGVDELPGTSNYFVGNDPAKWRTNVPTYAKVKYQGIYRGIDLVYYGNRRQLEYDFIVSPGADPSKIAFDIRGAKWIRRDRHGDLIFQVAEGKIRWHKPAVYQEKDGSRHEIAANYAITNTNRVGFELANYDPSRPLYIDPLIYSTFLGGSDYLDSGNSIAVDSLGNAYVTGATTSGEFPVTAGAFQTSFVSQNEDAFVTKISPDGSTLVYSTFLGDGTWNWGGGIAVDSSGDAYVAGGTYSPTFPTTPGAFNTTCTTSKYGECVYSNAFVAVLNPTGSALVYSTYLGDSGGEVFGIALDSSDNAYITGSTIAPDFPTTPGAFQTVCNSCTGPYQGNAFVSKLNPSGTALVYSSYLGGSGRGDPYDLGDTSSGIAVDSAGSAYVIGTTPSANFPVTSGAFQTSLGQSLSDAFVTKFNSAGSALVYSTYLGGVIAFRNNAAGSAIAVDSAGNAYVTGFAGSSFPVTPGAFQTTCALIHNSYPPLCVDSAFVTKLNPAGSALVYSTYLGGGGGAGGAGIATDRWGDAYVTGEAGNGFPRVNPVQKDGVGSENAFVTKFNAAGSALVFSTYLGGGRGTYGGTGIAIDSSGAAYVTGVVAPANFPITSGAFQTTCGGTNCPFVSKIFVASTTTTALTSSLNPSAFGQAVTLTAAVTPNAGIPPNGETITFEQGSTVLGTGTLTGGSASFTTSSLKVATDSIKAIYAGDPYYDGSTSNTIKQVVSKASTTTTVASSLNPSNSGQPVTFTATVAGQFGGEVTGSVTFMDGSTTLKKVTLSGGSAEYTTSKLASGQNTITATYDGSADFTDSSASLIQTVTAPGTELPNSSTLTSSTTDEARSSNSQASPPRDYQCPTKTTLTTSASPQYADTQVTFTATVFEPQYCHGIPTGLCKGTVYFYQGDKLIGTAGVNTSSCVAAFMDSSLPIGTFHIRGILEPLNDMLRNSTSKSITQVMVGSPTSTTLTSTLNPSVYGESVTWTATVTSPQGYQIQPTGHVEFTSSGSNFGGGQLNSNGVVTLTRKNVSAGTYALTAVYRGDTANAGSTSAVLNQVIQQATSTATLTSSPNPSNAGEAVTFTAKITSPTVVPTGTVTFTAGSTVLGSVELKGGKAALTTSTLPTGSSSITVTYPGNSSITGSSASLTQTVN